ncbi:MAG: FMN-binding negative transcriptional regulator [Chloroflexota bacterium]
MYIPKINRLNHSDDIVALMEEHSFATVVTTDEEGVPFATHMPVLLDKNRGTHGTLISHIARANPQRDHLAHAQGMDGQEILVIFTGPHAYISPSWYAGEFNVPTWNYMAVHAYGGPRLIEEKERLQEMLTELVAFHEETLSPEWRVPWSDERYTKLIQGIVGFEMEITRLEAKSKLNQNKTVADQEGVIQALRDSVDSTNAQVAVEMSKNLLHAE